MLLLDDVLSELDEGRKQYLLTRMKEKQTFVTSCDDTAFLKTDGEVYRMNGGVLRHEAWRNDAKVHTAACE